MKLFENFVGLLFGCLLLSCVVVATAFAVTVMRPVEVTTGMQGNITLLDNSEFKSDSLGWTPWVLYQARFDDMESPLVEDILRAGFIETLKDEFVQDDEGSELWIERFNELSSERFGDEAPKLLEMQVDRAG